MDRCTGSAITLWTYGPVLFLCCANFLIVVKVKALGGRERATSVFTKIFKLHHVRYVLRPIGMKGKIFELCFKEHFRAASAMLWEGRKKGRLSPAFLADAVAYSQFLFNRAPNDHIDSSTTPWSILTGEKPRWDKLRVFGCCCFEHIPKNEH